MLISEAYDSQPVCLRALDNGRPIHVHRDVRIPNLLEWRIEISMLGANLNISLKFNARISVVDGDHIASLQIGERRERTARREPLAQQRQNCRFCRVAPRSQ